MTVLLDLVRTRVSRRTLVALAFLAGLAAGVALGAL